MDEEGFAQLEERMSLARRLLAQSELSELAKDALKLDIALLRISWGVNKKDLFEMCGENETLLKYIKTLELVNAVVHSKLSADDLEIEFNKLEYRNDEIESDEQS